MRIFPVMVAVSICIAPINYVNSESSRNATFLGDELPAGNYTIASSISGQSDEVNLSKIQVLKSYKECNEERGNGIAMFAAGGGLLGSLVAASFAPKGIAGLPYLFFGFGVGVPVGVICGFIFLPRCQEANK